MRERVCESVCGDLYESVLVSPSEVKEGGEGEVGVSVGQQSSHTNTQLPHTSPA